MAELPAPSASEDGTTTRISLGALESEIEQTSDTLEILERIASIQQQQLEHQRTQVLRDVRGVFFALRRVASPSSSPGWPRSSRPTRTSAG